MWYKYQVQAREGKDQLYIFIAKIKGDKRYEEDIPCITRNRSH